MKLDIKKIMSTFDISEDKLAKALFPDHRYPIAAFRRLADGLSAITAEQVLSISRMTGASLDSLYAGTFKSSSTDPRLYVLGSNRVEVDMKRGQFKLYASDTLFSLHNFDVDMPVSLFFNLVHSKIN